MYNIKLYTSYTSFQNKTKVITIKQTRIEVGSLRSSARPHHHLDHTVSHLSRKKKKKKIGEYLTYSVSS